MSKSFFIAGIPTGILLCLTLLPVAHAEELRKEFDISDAQMRAMGIELMTIEAQETSVGARYPAQVVLPPKQQQVVSAPVAGLVNRLLVEENQDVAQGTPLLIMSSPELGSLQLELIQAANRARLAAQTVERERALFKEGIIPLRRVQEAEAAQNDSSAALSNAKAALELAGLSKAMVDQIATAGNVQNQITLTAKTSGTVIHVDVKPGQRVTAADPLLSLARLDTLWLDVQIPSNQATQWPKGTAVTIAGKNQAKVIGVSALANSAQTVVLRAEVAAAGTGLRPGEFVQAGLPLSSADTWDVPIAALARDGEQTFVFVREEGRFLALPVTVAATAGQRANISSALQGGQRIAVSGVIALKAAWQGAGGMEEE